MGAREIEEHKSTSPPPTKYLVEIQTKKNELCHKSLAINNFFPTPLPPACALGHTSFRISFPHQCTFLPVHG